MKKLLFNLTLILTCLNLFAEIPEDKAAVSGKVTDAKTGAPVEYATVALYNQANDALVTGTITMPDGKFKIDGIKSGTYYLKASFIGYNETTIRDINVQNKDIDLGTIKLETSDTELEEVEITAVKRNVEYKIDKKVVTLSGDVNADNGSAAEALEGVPSVDVDIDGNVSLRGSSNFTVLINGKPTALDAAEVLKQTPAAMIDNIEIITNPSAKYDPEGSTGIINLVTKKNIVQGINGVINANIGSQGRYGGDFLFNMRKNKFNYFVGGHYNQRGFNFNSKSNRITHAGDYDKYVNQESENKRRFGGGGLKTGFDFYPNDNNVLNFTIEGGMFGSTNEGGNDYENWFSSQKDPKYDHETVKSITDDEDDALYFNTSFSYTHNFAGQGHKLEASGFYSRNHREADNLFTQTATQTLNGNQTITGHQINDDRHTNRARFNLDYTKPLENNGKFEAGFQEDVNDYNTDYDYNDYVSQGIYSENPEFTHDVRFQRYISALYSTYAQTFGTFGLQLGLRGEYTHRLVDTKVEKYPIDRFDIFPSLHISKTVGERNSIQTGYSRRIRRPWEGMLNPFPAYSDEYSRRIGNPGLKPEYTDAVELNYQMNFDKMFWALETFYRHTTGSIENVSSLGANDILISRFENLSTNNNFGLELTGNYDPNKWIGFNVDFELRQYYIKGNYNGEDLSRKGNSWRTKERISITPGKTTKIQINMRYNGKNKTLISSNKGDFDLGLAIRQSFFKKRLALSFSMRDITGTRKNKSTTDTEEYYLYSERWRQAPMWNLGLSFKINNFKEKTNMNGGEDGGSYEDGGGDF